MSLIVSTRTMKGIKAAGVPLGTRCLSFAFHFDIKPIPWIANQSGKERLNVMLRWDVGAKV